MTPKHKILVVDDEHAIADTLAAILKMNDCDVRVAYSGQQALTIAMEFEPILMISDVVMPDKNGIEVATEMRERLPHCKVLLFSGQAATADLLLKARQHGEEWQILQKPVHPEDLLAKLDDLAA